MEMEIAITFFSSLSNHEMERLNRLVLSPPVRISPPEIPTGSQTTLHFCGCTALAIVQQGQMPFIFSRLWSPPRPFHRSPPPPPPTLGTWLSAAKVRIRLSRGDTSAVNQLELVKAVTLEVLLLEDLKRSIYVWQSLRPVTRRSLFLNKALCRLFRVMSCMVPLLCYKLQHRI